MSKFWRFLLKYKTYHTLMEQTSLFHYYIEQNWANRTCALSSSRKNKITLSDVISLIKFTTWLIRNLPPTVENCPKESSEATLMPFSRVVTWVTWSCWFCHSAPQTMSGGGAVRFGRGSLSGGIAPLLKSLFRKACLEVLLKERSDLQPWNIGTKLRPAIAFSFYRGRHFYSSRLEKW